MFCFQSLFTIFHSLLRFQEVGVAFAPVCLVLNYILCMMLYCL